MGEQPVAMEWRAGADESDAAGGRPGADANVDASAPGHSSRGALFLLALLVSAAVVAVIEMPRITRGPLSYEILYPGARPGPIALTLAAWAAGVVAALCGCVGLRPGRVAGGFGVVASAGLAAAVTCAVYGMWLPDVGRVWSLVGAATIGIAAALAAPLLRDRGMVSLLVVSLLLCAVIVPARRSGLADRGEAQRLASVREAVIQCGLQRLLVSVDPGLAIEFRQALAVSLRPPQREDPIDLLCVEHDSREERSLLAAGWRGVRLEDDEVRVFEASESFAAMRGPSPFEVTVRELTDRGPVAVLDPSQGRFTLHVVTPAGAVRQNAEDPIHGIRLLGEAFERYQALMQPLPPDVPVYLMVDTPGLGRGSAWLELVR